MTGGYRPDLGELLDNDEAEPRLAPAPCSLRAGTRIRFLKTLEEGPDEESPGRHYATVGDGGEVVDNGTPPKEGHWVKWDRWPHCFGATLGVDFEVANAEPLPPTASVADTENL